MIVRSADTWRVRNENLDKNLTRILGAAKTVVTKYEEAKAGEGGSS